MFRYIIKQTKLSFNNARNAFLRKYPPPRAGVPEYGLSELQVYPFGSHFKEVVRLGFQATAANLCIDKDTITASIGTCFAEEFSKFIKNSGGSYLYLEKNVFNSSAEWGRVYTIPNLEQIVTYSLEKDTPILICSSSGRFFDAYRERSVKSWDSYAQCEREINNHRKQSGRVFSSAEVLVVTLGQNEGWLDKKESIIWGSMPPRNELNLSPNRYTPVEFSYDENLRSLTRLIENLLSNNKKLKIILTVSPVPAFATFLSESIVAQAFAGKCILRSVVHEVVKKFPGKLYYFPSFEIAFCENKDNFCSDNRHVKSRTVRDIFSILREVVFR